MREDPGCDLLYFGMKICQDFTARIESILSTTSRVEEVMGSRQSRLKIIMYDPK